MPGHQIRFRGAWEWLGREGEVEVARRVTLPTAWTPGSVASFRLVRHFGRPPVDPETESIRLEFRNVPGLISARLNDVELARPEGATLDWVVPLAGPLQPRNELVLEVDLGSTARDAEGPPWGSISLRIDGV